MLGNVFYCLSLVGQRLDAVVVVTSCRIKYEETIGDIRKAVAAKAGIEESKVQLFRHGKELVPEVSDGKTLLEMDLHTGFSLMGYDLTEEPVYWPPVRKTDAGLEVIPAKDV